MDMNYCEQMREQAKQLCNAGRSLAAECGNALREAEAARDKANKEKLDAEKELTKLKNVISDIKIRMRGVE